MHVYQNFYRKWNRRRSRADELPRLWQSPPNATCPMESGTMCIIFYSSPKVYKWPILINIWKLREIINTLRCSNGCELPSLQTTQPPSSRRAAQKERLLSAVFLEYMYTSDIYIYNYIYIFLSYLYHVHQKTKYKIRGKETPRVLVSETMVSVQGLSRLSDKIYFCTRRKF